MRADRRQFLAHAARVATWAAAATSASRMALAASNGNGEANGAYPFALGVASGSPRPTSVVLWTRLISDPFHSRPYASVPLGVRWEIADDEAFKRIAAKGIAAALPELAHSVHVDVTGLQPGRWYWYRFMLGDAVSPIARTRTAPSVEAMPASLRFAFASCQHWEFGEFAAHRHIALAAPDLVVFLGDYIYEWGPYDKAHPAQVRRGDASATLADYRARYAQYKTDLHLQAAHRVAPWIVTWDDHEVANDYGNDRDEALEPNFIGRRAAAYQAFYEHMPVRLSGLPSGDHRYAHMRIHERYDWGRLARFHMLDDRQFRSYLACPKLGRGGSNSVTNSCAERRITSRTMLGKEQEAWLAQGFASSGARWNFLGQQTLMAQMSQIPVLGENGGRFWTDGWDGYPAARNRLFDDIVKHRPANPVVLSGDIHTFCAAELKRDFNRPTSAANPLIATEFCGTSITSSSRPQSRTDRYLADNPHIKFARSDTRGFVMMEVTSARTAVQFQGLDDVSRADSGLKTIAGFVVEDGQLGVRRV